MFDMSQLEPPPGLAQRRARNVELPREIALQGQQLI